MPKFILFNGKIHATPPASAIAVRDRKILAVGNEDDMKALANSRTQQIDLGGRRVLPGLSDAHIHFYDWATGRRGLELGGATSLADMLAQLQDHIRTIEPGRWIKGRGWNESEWPHPVMPTRQDLDAVSVEHPMILWRSDHHAAVVNSLALQLAGIDANTPPPSDGVIEEGASGQPSGILKELAIEMVSQQIPFPAEAEVHQAMFDGIAELHKLGLTGLHDQRLMAGVEGPPALRAYQHLRDHKQLKLRLTTNIHYSQLPHAIGLGLKSGFGDDYLRLGFVKMFSDGSMGARTAWMLQPYEDGGLGMAAMPAAEMAEIAHLAGQNGWAVSVHAIGDRANREVLDIFEEVAANAAKTRIPHRIEHAQTLHPDDLPRLGRLGITASVQPIHLLDDMVLLGRILGDRGDRAYAFRGLLDSGAILALGSDCPIASPNPWLGVHAAVNRRKPSGEPDEGWYPKQRLTIAEAVWGYTMGNAIAVGQQNRLGSIAPGKLADLIALDRDIFQVDPMTLAETQVVMTIFDGEVVWKDDKVTR